MAVPLAGNITESAGVLTLTVTGDNLTVTESVDVALGGEQITVTLARKPLPVLSNSTRAWKLVAGSQTGTSVKFTASA